MNAINWKRLILPNIPYLLFMYLFDKVGQAVRLAPGADLSGKVLSLADGFSAAFANPLPSLAPMDLLTGLFGAVLIRLIVYVKGKNAKKYRKGVEYINCFFSLINLINCHIIIDQKLFIPLSGILSL